MKITIENCLGCAHHKVELQDDVSCDYHRVSAQRVVCSKAKKAVTSFEAPHNLSKHSDIPNWCPLAAPEPLLVELNDENMKKLGFAGTDEFFHLVSAVDLSTSAKRAAFRHWQHNDGSRAGLLNLGVSS